MKWNITRYDQRSNESTTTNRWNSTTLQKMMDLTDAHGRALLSFLVSTGCRPGETCEILLSDVKGDMVAIRNEIAKGHHGGTVFLTAEAREYIDLWLRERDAWIKTNRARAVKLRAGPKPKPGEPDTRKTHRDAEERPAPLCFVLFIAARHFLSAV